MIGLNLYQIIFISGVLGITGIIYGRKFYKSHKKKQANKTHRKEWKSRF